MGTRASEAARAVNALSLLEFAGDDQQSLLEVIQDYFTLPEVQDDGDSDADDLDDDDDAVLEGIHFRTIKLSQNKIKIKSK